MTTLEAIQNLSNLLNSKYSTTFSIDSKESDIRFRLPTPLILDQKLNYELGLSWFSVYNRLFNINETNNKFFSIYRLEHAQKIELSPGAYEIKNLSNIMNIKICKQLKIEVDPKNLQIELIPDLTNGKCLMKNKVSIIFSEGLAKLLGFEGGKKYDAGEHLSENNINISNVTRINIECDQIEGGYVDMGIIRSSIPHLRTTNIIYSFPAFAVPFGFKILERMNPPIYFPLISKTISEMRIRILDQNGNLLSFNGEDISMYLHLRQV